MRVVETTLTAVAYGALGLFSSHSMRLVLPVAPAVLLGLPIGAYLIRYLNSETFRRICMSFDAWIVGFGVSRTIIELRLLKAPSAYALWAIVILFDLCLLYQYLAIRRFRGQPARREGTAPVDLPPRRAAGM